MSVRVGLTFRGHRLLTELFRWVIFDADQQELLSLSIREVQQDRTSVRGQIGKSGFHDWPILPRDSPGRTLAFHVNGPFDLIGLLRVVLEQ